MKLKYCRIISAVVFSLFVMSVTVRAVDTPVEGKQISKAEAEKKYPPGKSGTYPMGLPHGAGTPGFFDSPYTGNKVFDCRTIPHGALVLDQYANKVFIRP